MDSDSPVSFGYKMGWLAIRSTDRDAVVRSLQLSDPAEVTWREGIDALYENGLKPLNLLLGRCSTIFVSPAVNGWTLVVGRWTAGSDEELGVRQVERLITRASSEFGEVQAFASHRVIEYHHWMLARNSDLVRSFAYIGERGEVLTDSGEPTPVELGFKWYPLREEDADLEEEEILPNEESVMKVAGAWSVNPQLLETFPSSSSRGVLAKAPPIQQQPQNAEAGPARRPWWRFW